MKRIPQFVRKNLITTLLLVVGILMMISCVMIFYNRKIANETIVMQSIAEQAKHEIIFSHLNVVRDVDVSIRGFAIVRDESLLYIKPDQLKTKMEKAFATLDSILTLQNYDDPGGRKAVQDYQDYIRVLVEDHRVMAEHLRNHNDSAFLEIFKQDKGKHMGGIMDRAQQTVITWENQQKKQAQMRYNQAMQENIYIQLFMLATGIPSIFLVILRLRKEKRDRSVLLKHLDQSNRKYLFDSGIELRTDDPRSIIQESVKNLQDAANFVTGISKGDYQLQWQGITAMNDSLNKQNLAGKLLGLQEELKRIKLEDEKRFWVNDGLAKFSEVVRNNQENFKDLADETLRFICRHVNIQQGSLFIANQDIEPQTLQMAACYAFDKKKYHEKTILPGEGLVGQVFLEKTTSVLTNLPKNYVNITSGLGDATPTCLALVPLKYNDSVSGILELAGFKKFEPHQINFLEKACEFLAASILTVKNAERMKELLAASMQQAEELKAQEEEMRQNMEELSATQEELSRKNKELETQFSGQINTKTPLYN